MASQGKVALVTGGGSGIGRSAALALQGDGWNVVVAGRRKEELDKTVAMAKAGGGKIVAVRAETQHASQRPIETVQPHLSQKTSLRGSVTTASAWV